MLARLAAGVLAFVFSSPAQAPWAADPLDIARIKDYAAYRSSSNNVDLGSNDDSKRPIPGETITLADLTGPGVVTHIWLTVAANEYAWPRLLRFRVYYDGSPIPGIDAPLGDFFAVGHGQERGVNSIMIRNSSSGRSRNSYWPMPFRKSCRITVTNEGRRRVSNLYYHVDWRKVATLPADIGYLHARYRQELTTNPGELYEILNVKGSGHYVGTVLNVIQNEAGWFGEGDDYFYVDGSRKAVIEGTGTEDYVNDAWSLRVADGPYAGVSIAEGTGLGARLSAFRWHVPDPVPFTQSLRFGIEHAGWTFNADGSVRSAFEPRADLFSSVAFWYHKGVAEGLPVVPFGAARLPHGNARQIEVETLLPDVKTEGGSAEVQKEVFWSRDLLFLNAAAPGARIHIPIDITERGDYELVAQVAHSPDYGTYAALLDGAPIASDVRLEHEPGANLSAPPLDAYHTEVYVAEDHLLGWKTLSPGRHTLTFECTGKNQSSSGYNLGIDTVVLARIGKPDSTGGAAAERLRAFGTGTPDIAALRNGLVNSDPFVREAAAWAFTGQREAARASVPELAAALGDSDAVVRGLAALALRDCGTAAKTATAPLVEHLKDSDENVRLASAEALAASAPEPAVALAPLIAAAKRPGENVQVQRSVVKALGALGPAASTAVPVLNDLAKLPRVRWAADAALRSIKGGAGARP